MKRIILSLAAMLTIGAAAFANNLPGDNAKAVATFKKEFSIEIIGSCYPMNILC